MNETLLKKRISEAPRMEPTDAVKLVYQSEFGCGHLLSAQEECAAAVRREMAQTTTRADMPPATAIGGGLCWLNLASPPVRALAPQIISRMMRLTAERIHGSTARFETGLALLRRLADEGGTPFSAQALEAYLAAYREAGYPPVSHSERYREAYAPAYRVVLSDFAALLPVVTETEARLCRGGSALVVLDGDCGAGKTTLGNLLCGLYETKPIRMDDFFLPFEMRTPVRMAEPGGNIHYERFENELLASLASGGSFLYRRYDCRTGSYIARTWAGSAVTVIEGSYSQHPRFWEAYRRLGALRVFVWVECGEQLRRLALRDPEKLARFENEWIPLEKSYFQAYDIKSRADIALKSKSWEDEA